MAISRTPKRLYYSISDVSEMVGVKPHVLRYWESEFSLLKPKKSKAGRRTYTQKEIKLIRYAEQNLCGKVVASRNLESE